jgi:hypothetical protein
LSGASFEGISPVFFQLVLNQEAVTTTSFFQQRLFQFFHFPFAPNHTNSHMSHHHRHTRVTSETVERNIRQQRDIENQKRDLAAFGKENANLLSVASSQAKIESQRRMTQQQLSRNELQYEETLKQKQYEKKMRELTATQNQALATEIDKDSAGAERRKREIQKICEEAPELRELEKMLKIAYLNKERAAQYQEKITLAMREQERIQSIEDQMEADRIKSLQRESAADLEKKRKLAAQRLVLQEQIREKQDRLREVNYQYHYYYTNCL